MKICLILQNYNNSKTARGYAKHNESNGLLPTNCRDSISYTENTQLEVKQIQKPQMLFLTSPPIQLGCYHTNATVKVGPVQ